MTDPRPRSSTFLSAVLAIAAASIITQAQPAQEGRAALYGTWVLNRELTQQPSGALDPGARGGGPRGGRGGGFPGGVGGGGRRGGGMPGGMPGGGGRGGGRGGRDDQEAMERVRELLGELARPSTRWVITPSEGGAISFTDADGRTMKFETNDKKEKHQLASGTFETKTRWERGGLRQEIDVPGGPQLVRMFTVSPETGQLVVETTARGGRGGQQTPVRWVYDDGDARR